MDVSIIRRFEELSSADVEFAGGKGAALAELMRAGIPVPPGFVVLTEAFHQFLELADLEQEIELSLRNLQVADQLEIDRVSAYFREQILQTPIPKELATEIYRAFDALRVSFVAVRSSATAEDGLEATWAGQLESYLNCRRETLLDDIRRCWASLFTSRALFYRIEQGLRTRDVGVAVVVQQMIESDASGVAFSVHPVTQDPDQMVIEAGYGLGEAVVSGQITPDTYLLDKRSLTIQEVQLNRQKQALHRSEGGGNAWSELEDHKIGARVLCDEEVMELAKIILRIEALSDFPVDVEWVQEKDHFFIVQARPITTLVRMVKHANQELDLSVLKTKVWTYDVSRRFNWFVQATQLKAMQREVQVRYTGYQFPTENYLIANGDEYSCKEDQVRIHEQFSDAFKADEYFFQHLAVKIEGILAETERYTNALRHIDFQSFSTEKLRDALEHFSERYLVSFLPAWMRPDAFLESEVRSRLQQELGFSTAEVERAFAALATPLHHGLAYADEPLALLGVAKRIRSFQGAATLLSPVIEDLLKYHEECYGWMKSPVFPELRTFTVSEYRERITYLLEQPLDELIHQTERVRYEREQAYQGFMDQYQPSTTLRRLCNALRAFIWLRTRTTEVSDQLFFWGRKTLFLELGKRLQLSAEEIVMLSADEIVSLLLTNDGGFQEMLAKRLCGYAITVMDGEVQTCFGEPALLLQSQARRLFGTQMQREADVIQGQCASPGRVKGLVRVVTEYADVALLEPGEILVASMTLPEYTQAMEKAAAFITDEGGITCHAAIIAREMGKPCVIGTADATRVLQTGDLVEVDAEKGIVKMLERAKKG